MPFADIVGHERVVEIFRRAIRTGKASHAYVFEGPSGCGRRKTALALIQALFCGAVDDDACGVCPSCRKVAAGNHADIHLIEPLPDKRDISIAQLRDLQRDLALRPYEAPRKACILEPADRMNVSSANSFLKTLEEPPGNAIIILLTENADMLLPTIRSRCQLIRFAPLSPEHVRLLLEQQGMDAASASLLAPLAEGSMQRAQGFDNDALTARRELVLKHLCGISLERIATVFDASEELSGNREGTLEMLDMLLSFARDMIYLAAGQQEITNSAVRPALQNLAGRMGLKKTMQLADDILATRRSVQRNANAKLALDHLMMKMAGATAA
ncbi:DNA polymerase III subunit delta' [Geobacter sp. SVR]|uniref:DNA polymerase III subunit delta' n=1 Tax=Geobacter sp. SVR TaxID=2495594 RepID=UPI00143EF624|nr:DNA polymerase III subunit delta' [Geobacter sp. SVR]BCS53803.1 DNA polymerase III subunit delta' [Geobacter sp. SVR]GCF85688.1 DNA polymerase III subunit delta' [Geobacter sp. SVR]